MNAPIQWTDKIIYTEDRITFKNIDPDISQKFQEAFMDWKRRKDENRE